MQKDVVAESAEILQMGLLFGEDIQATTEDLPAVLSFQHKLLQEYLAAVYIVDNIKLDTTSTFLEEAFPTWGKIESHREVVKFACGLLAETDANPITHHVAKVLAQDTRTKLNTGAERHLIYHLDIPLSLLASFQREGKVSNEINPYLCEYPACGRPLGEVLANTELACITDIDKSHTLELNPSSAQVILCLKSDSLAPEKEKKTVTDWFDRLWRAFLDTQTDVIAIYMHGVQSSNAVKLSHYPNLKYLHLEGKDLCYDETSGEGLAESINAWGPTPQLRTCTLHDVPIPRSLMTTLSRCTQLFHLKFSGSYVGRKCNLKDKVSLLMASAPPKLKFLGMQQCFIQGGDVHHIIQAVKEGHLSHLEELIIEFNPVGEVAMGRLLETLIFARQRKQLKVKLTWTGVDEVGKEAKLSGQFETEWKAKLTGTNIDVEW